MVLKKAAAGMGRVGTQGGHSTGANTWSNWKLVVAAAAETLAMLLGAKSLVSSLEKGL